MSTENTFNRFDIHAVSRRTKLDTFGITKIGSFFADQTTNRDSASWKVAEFIIVDIRGSESRKDSLLKKWVELTSIDPIDPSPQKLILQENYNLYSCYDSLAKKICQGTLDDVLNVVHPKTISPKVAIVQEPDASQDPGVNLLLYGVPGAGKSWFISQKYCKNEDLIERVVFHPDYTYSDFIGQILPVVTKNGEKSDISYKFVPGPFTRILKSAHTTKGPFYLIIEEINRGNAPAIFGDIFQLLDRHEGGEKCGESVFGISNANIAEFVYGDPDHKIRIPSNLSIIGTMNTSDQNVFTLDTAFQRRWEMCLVKNDFADADDKYQSAKILDTGVTWKHFVKVVNESILTSNSNLSSLEDKRLGVYFVKSAELAWNSNQDSTTCSPQEKLAAEKQNARFAHKVLKYLWDDAFKFNRDNCFNSKLNSLEQVITEFQRNRGLQRFSVFSQEVFDKLSSEKSE